MMQVTGEEGVTQDDFITQQKAALVDMVYLQQDAFDDVDVSTSIERQKETFGLLIRIAESELSFDDKAAARRWFSRMTDAFKNLNYAKADTELHREHWQQVEGLLGEVSGR